MPQRYTPWTTLAFLFLFGVALIGCPGELADKGRFTNPGGGGANSNVTPNNTGGDNRCAPGFNVEAQIFAVKCGSAQCHSTTAQASGLDLQAPGVGQRLRNKPSVDPACSTQLLINTAAVEQSYFYRKLVTTDGICGGIMPSGQPMLSTAELNCVQVWLEQNAQ